MPSLQDVARLIGAQVIGDPLLVVNDLKTIDQAGDGDLTFVANPKYLAQLPGCRATAIVVGPGVEAPGKNLLVCAHPYLAFAKILTHFRVTPYPIKGVMPGAIVDETALLGTDVSLYPGVVIGEDAVIGDRTVILPNTVIYAGAQIGSDCLIHAGCVIREGCRLGQRVILQPGAVIGADGFGFAPDGEAYYKIPQVGIVVIEDDVEIGACACVDRAALGETRIGQGCKIDNLVQVGHNVEIGPHGVIAAQTAFAGSCRIGRHATFGGQSAVTGHVKLGDNITLAGKSGVISSLAGDQIYAGIPAIPHQQWLKSSLLFGKLPEMKREISALHKRLQALEEQLKEQNP